MGVTSDESSAQERAPLAASHLRAVRLGHGANCSSIGSVLDLLFASAAVGTAIFVAAAAAARSAGDAEAAPPKANDEAPTPGGARRDREPTP